MAAAALRLVASPLSWLAPRRLGRLVDHLVRLDDRLLADMGITRSEIATLKF